jgi:uncharacterized protein DUF3311
MAADPTGRRRKGSRAWNLLLFLPFIALLWVPFYDSMEPRLWSFPFFYWYQFLWVFITSGLVLIVHSKTE